MKKVAASILAFLALAIFGTAQAQEFPVTGKGASGKPGDRVFVELTYDYGPSFNVLAEDFAFTYDNAALLYRPGESTIDLYAPIKTLPQHVGILAGGALDNLMPNEYRLSYSSVTGQVRSGLVHVAAAFDILPGTAPGNYRVSFSGNLSDGDNEFSYSPDLQALTITVAAALAPVPEPGAALMLVSGMLLLGSVARRRKVARL